MRLWQSPFIAILSHRPFLRLWLCQVLSQLAANITLFLLALLVYRQTGSNTAVSGLFIAYGIPSLAFGMLAGMVVDYIDKRKIILFSCIMRALLVLGLLFVSKNIFLVYVLLFLNAIVMQFFLPAESTMIPTIVSSSELVSANSLFSFAYYSSMAIGFILAGPLLRLLGPYPSIIMLALLFLISFFLAYGIPKGKEDERIWKKIRSLDIGGIFLRVISGMKNGISYVRHSHLLFDSVLLLTGTQIIFVLLGTLGPGFADQMLAIDVTDASLVLVGPAILGILIGALWVGNRGYRYASQRLIETGIIGAGISLIIISTTIYMKRYGVAPWLFQDTFILPLELFLFFLLGFFNSLLDVPANSILQKEAEGDMRGRVYGLLGVFVGGVGILPVIIGGVLADVVGVGKVILVLGILIVLYGGYRIRYYKV